VVVDDVALMEAGCGGGDHEVGFGFGRVPEVEVVRGLLVGGVGGGVADEGEGVGVFCPDKMLVLGFAGDEFARVATGGRDYEDAVGFGLVGGDGVGEGFAVAGDLVVEDFGEVAAGLRG
jgi:hypothetical protein